MGGLGAAISLRLAGHNVLILEAARDLGEVGAGIQCLPNSTKILRSWDVHNRLASKASPSNRVYILGWKGDVISSQNLARTGEEHGATFNDFHRADLHTVLLDRAVELGAEVRTRSEVTDIKFVTEGENGYARVSIRAKPDEVADLVIGADGINSRCREILLGHKEPPHRTGDMAYRLLLDANDIRKDPELKTFVDDKSVYYWYGPQAHAVCYPLRHASLLNMVLIVPDNMPEEGPSTLQGYVEEMLHLFRDWDPRYAIPVLSSYYEDRTDVLSRINKILSLCPGVLRWRLCIRNSIDTWTDPSGCFTLLGDSAHATLPYLASGAGITFEDAAVLGLCLDRIKNKSTAEKKKALSVYERCRKLRTETVVKRGSLQQDLNHLDDGREQIERDARMREFEEIERAWEAGKRDPLPAHLKPGDDPLVWRRHGVGDWLLSYIPVTDVEARWDDAVL